MVPLESDLRRISEVRTNGDLRKSHSSNEPGWLTITELQLAAILLHDGTSNRKAESEAVPLIEAPGGVSAVKWFEDALSFRFHNSRPVILDLDDSCRSVAID